MKSRVDGDLQRADQVRQKHERAFQHADQVQRLGIGMVALDFGRQLADPFLYLFALTVR